MKEYFNEYERTTHLKITCCQVAIEDMLKTNAPTDEERAALETAMNKIEEFATSVYARLGDAYRRKVLRTNPMQCRADRRALCAYGKRRIALCFGRYRAVL